MATMQTIPNELLMNIFRFLDAPRTSTLALNDEPSFKITHAAAALLKAVSLVSKRWRRAILPLLFKHTRVIVSRSHGSKFTLNQEIQPFLDFATRHSLTRDIASFTLVIDDEHIIYNHDGPDTSTAIATFWETLFDIIDLTDLLIVAPVETLGVLTLCDTYMDDAWSFDCPCHYLRLQSSGSSRSISLDGSVHNPSESSSDGVSGSTIIVDVGPPRKSPSSLFAIRPWTSLLLNEGSFIKAYSTYEFWLRQAPSILPSLLGAEDEGQNPRVPRICSTIRDLSYIGMFPMASHFAVMTMNFPKLDRFYVQVVPRNDILLDPTKVRLVETEDLWMERNSCYSLLMRELFNSPPIRNFRHLQIFESGDAADKDAWGLAVDFIRRVNSGWKVAAEGVFERDPEHITQEIHEGGEVGFSLGGSLIRCAFNGTVHVPVSPYPIYDRPMGLD